MLVPFNQPLRAMPHHGSSERQPWSLCPLPTPKGPKEPPDQSNMRSKRATNTVLSAFLTRSRTAPEIAFRINTTGLAGERMLSTLRADIPRLSSTAMASRFLCSTGAGVTTTIDRDLLGRVWSATPTYPGQSSTSAESFVWDTAANGVGKLAEATSPDGIKTSYVYDSLGRLSRQQWDLNSGASYALETVWDSFDRPQYFKYPAVGARQLVLEYHYQPQGELYGVTNQTSNNETYWKLLKEDASGIPLSEQFGASNICNRTLDEQKRVLAIETTMPPVGIATSPIPVQQLSYGIWSGRLISTRHNVPDSDTATENFDYDYLGRLWHWTVLQKGTTFRANVLAMTTSATLPL